MMIYGKSVTISEKKSYTFINQFGVGVFAFGGINVKYCFRKANKICVGYESVCVPYDRIDSKYYDGLLL